MTEPTDQTGGPDKKEEEPQSEYGSMETSDFDSKVPETVDATNYEDDDDDDATRLNEFTTSAISSKSAPTYYRPLLIGLAGPNKGMRYQINNHLTIVGRSSSSTWKLNDHAASRQHFRITYENHIAPDQVPVCTIDDMGSRNGTELNGEKLKQPITMKERDRISVGQSVIGFFVRDDEELKQDQSLYLNATQDPLTGLKNRRMLQQYLKYHMKQAEKYSLPLAMILIDIDFFKKVNDTYGHDVGDDALCHLSDILRVSVREDDLLSRWGGEEFGIAMGGVSKDAAAKLAERLRETTELTPMELGEDYDDDELKMTISVGGAEFKQGDTIESLFQRCDQALYKAKKNGRNQVVFD